MRPTAVVLVVLVVLLAGCGGGGGADTTVPNATGDDPTTTGTATPAPPPATTTGTPAPPTTTATPTPDPRPDWVTDDGRVDGAALERVHYAAVPPTYHVSVVRSSGRNLSLYGGPDAARLDVGDGPAVGYYDADATSARRVADRPTAYEYGAVPRPNTTAVYASVLGTYPGQYLSLATAEYDSDTADGHRIRLVGVDGEPPAPGTEGRLIDLSGTATVRPDGLVRSLTVTETVRTPDGDRVERSVTVRTERADAVPKPPWLDDVPGLRGVATDDRRTFTVDHAGGAPVANGTTLMLRTETGVVGTTTLNGTVAAGERLSLSLVTENGTERLVAVANGTAPTENATGLPADAYLVVETEAYVVRAGVERSDEEGD